MANRLPPMFVVDTAKRLHRFMTSVQRKMAPPSAAMLELVSSAWRPRAIGAAARLGVADHLANGPLELPELARRTAMGGEQRPRGWAAHEASGAPMLNRTPGIAWTRRQPQ